MNNKYEGKVLTYFELISNLKIEIPIIQRDYAQGRVDKKDLRTRFLNALKDSIKLNKSIKLDFIYGSASSDIFQPLDGQQRLTTLFLLHWYAAAKDGQLNNETKNLLRRFSYETRITSREFCSSLIKNSIEFVREDLSLTDKIIDSNWFFLNWKKDPSIDSMLRTIDDIHLIFKEFHNLWDNLVKSKLISFYYVELENIGLTDDLYIKMNARGKQLSPFENFKATFQQRIEDNGWEQTKNIPETFAVKIDTDWTDYFWQDFKKSNSIDDALMRFIGAICMINQVLERSISGSTETRIDRITKIQDNPNSVQAEYFNEAIFNYLTDSFNIYQRNKDLRINQKFDFIFWRHEPKNSILSEIVFSDNHSTAQTSSATYSQKVLFFAQTEYLRRGHEILSDKFTDWMRVVRNIVSRADIDKDGKRPDIVRSPNSFDGCINLINELSEGCDDIYTYFSKNPTLKSQFAKEQIEEEKVKAQLIITYPEIKEKIFQIEDHDLLRGKISFIFYCMDYNYDVTSFDLMKFKSISNVLIKYFSNENNLNNDLRRALFTIEVGGSYEFYGYWWSYWNLMEATKRRLFGVYRELEYYINSDFREYFKKLVIELTSKNLDQIASDFIPPANFPNWKLRLIKEKELLDKHGTSTYIAISSDNTNCYLLKSKRPRDIDGSIKVE
ncbi:MAG TPA: DUF262 domain-containing protein [Flavipsychrobacter sp.]|nr:DUF262 domain-containing protein [Flavipsychrobacter sp.]